MEVLPVMSAHAPWLSGSRGAVAAVAVSCGALMMGAYANLSIAPIAPLIRADLGISLTGIGLITPLGNDTASTWDGLVAGRSGIGYVTNFDASMYEFPSG